MATEKVELVGQAYRDLDAAVEGSASETAQRRVSILMCRASVSSAVPDEVFGKAAQGAADFEEAASLTRGDKALEECCLEGAALAFEKAGLHGEARARWALPRPSPALPARVRLELLDRGFEIQK